MVVVQCLKCGHTTKHCTQKKFTSTVVKNATSLKQCQVLEQVQGGKRRAWTEK